MAEGTRAIVTRKKGLALFFILLALLISPDTWTGNIDEVTFLVRVEPYEAIVNATLVTQEGKRIPIERGTRLNVAGFTKTEAFVISRTDKPNGFIRKDDIAPARR
jgi:hypothetical protein